VFVQVIERPERKLILKRGKSAQDYFEFCEEVGCDVWGILCSVKEALYEPIGAWLPDRLIPAGTSRYVQGVEVPNDYSGIVPEGFEIIGLGPCSMMVFQGPAYDDDDASFCDAISFVQESIEKYKPSTYGYAWADEESPRFQLEPQGWRGYIEARPVKRLV
ncbi:MAG TPA: AraC family transcriptional regulator, partial [Bacillota bacterium]|nr:AraC family transcriptional regulator [Bacillota bacterium]